MIDTDAADVVDGRSAGGPGADPGAVAITPNGRTLVIARAGTDQLQLVNTVTLESVGLPPVGSSPEAVAITPDGTHAYIPQLGGETVSVVDLRTFAVEEVEVGAAPAAVAITPDGTRVYVANSGSGTVSVIDTRAPKVLETIVVGAAPGGSRSFPTSRPVPSSPPTVSRRRSAT